MADNDLIKNTLSCLNKHAFAKYVFSVYKSDDRTTDSPPLEAISDSIRTYDLSEKMGEYVFEQEYFTQPELHGFRGIFIYTEPLDLFYKLSDLNIESPFLVKSVKKYKKLMKEREINWFFPQDGTFVIPQIAFVTNYVDISKDDYQQILFPKFEKLIKNWDDQPQLLIGSIDSFVELQPAKTEKTLAEFMSNYKDELCISLVDDRLSINSFAADNYIPNGVLRNSKNPCESVTLKPTDKSQAILEFEELINRNVKENVLELFLQKHYQEIFGFEYDKIETQVWLRFPELDISNENRRLDIFLRNSIENDWEIFEIKRAKKLTKSYRDIPVFKDEIISSIQQLRNYKNILSQDTVKRKMEKEGIEYYVPTLKLVIGRTPNIQQSQWRWLKTTNEHDVKIITYDELLESMKKRIKYHSHD